MAQNVFAFDLGSNSLGYAVVNKESKKIVTSGVNVFPMGVNLEKGTIEIPKNGKRREKRQIRRQNFRQRMRKEILARELATHKMFPCIETLHEKYHGKTSLKPRQKWETLIRATPLCEELRSFFSMNPYELRHRAFEGEKLCLLEIGRILYQMIQRRGYRETLHDQDLDGTLYVGKPEDDKTGIDETQRGIEQFGTLGNYLHHLDPHECRIRNRYTLRSMYEKEFDLIWQNLSQFYPDILTDNLYRKLGFRHQSKSHENGILFHYRPLRSMRHLLGKCSFEKAKRVAPMSCLDFERFRAFQFANNIRYQKAELSQDDKQTVVHLVLANQKKFDFVKISKKLKKDPNLFNYEASDKAPGSPTTAQFSKILGDKWLRMSTKEKEDLWHHKFWTEDATKLRFILTQTYGLNDVQAEQIMKFRLAEGYCNLSRKAIRGILLFMEMGFGYDKAVLLAGVRNAIGPEKFDHFPESQQKSLIKEILKLTLKTIDDSNGTSIDKIRQWLLDHLALTDKQLNKLYHHSVKNEGNGSMKLLPIPADVKNPIVMKAMFQYRKVFNQLVLKYGEPSAVKIELARELKNSKKARSEQRKKQRQREDENDQIKTTLDEYGLPHSTENIQKLKLFNEIVERHGKCINPYVPENTISIQELLRPDGFIQIEHIIPQSISLDDSLGNKTLCDADTNRLKGNLTPFQYFDKYRPQDWPTIKDNIFSILPYHKAKKFISEKDYVADDFVARQLNDSRYISKLAAQFTRNACRDVQVTQGGLTSMLRYYWGLDSILSTSYSFGLEDGEYFAAIDENEQLVEARIWSAKTKKQDMAQLNKKGLVIHGQSRNGQFNPIKTRDDHRHHAIDAIVVACAERKHLKSVSTYLTRGLNKKDLKYNREYQIERPWEGFWNDVKSSIDGILVHHDFSDKVLVKVKKKLFDYEGNPKINRFNEPIQAEGLAARGQLHEETVFGKHINNEGEVFYHVRKPIDFIQNHKHLDQVVDKRVRQAIFERLHKLYPVEKLVEGKLPEKWSLNDLNPEDKKSFFFEIDDSKNRRPMIELHATNGQSFPVKRARTKHRASAISQLKTGVNQYVKGGNNHHLLIYRKHDQSLEMKIETFWTVAQRAKNKKPKIQIPDDGVSIENVFIKNEMFLIGLSEQQITQYINNDRVILFEHLYRVQKISSSGYKAEFRHHAASTVSNTLEWQGFSSISGYKELNPTKVNIDLLGNITLASLAL